MLGPSGAAWLGLPGAAWLGLSMLEPVAPVPGPGPRVEIEWSAPARCPSAHAVRERLTRALADSAVDPRGLRARAQVTEGEGQALVLSLELDRDDGPVGRRTLRADDCDELATAAVLIVALAVDPAAALEEPPTEPTEPPPMPNLEGDAVPPEPAAREPPATLEPARPEPATPEPPATSDRPPRELHAGLRVGAGAGLSVLANASAVVSAAAAAWGRAARVELGASYWTPVEVRAGDDATGGRLQQWTVDARGCGVLRPGPLEVPLCGGLDVGAVHGVGVGVPLPRRAASLRLAVAAGATLVWRPARWQQRVGPWIGAELAVALVRARFRATPAAPGLVYHTPPVGGRVAAGIEVRFR